MPVQTEKYDHLLLTQGVPTPLNEQLDYSKKGGGAQNGGPAPKKKKIDANANPCHGQVYSGACAKKDCPFNHHVARCAAYKAEHPDGPPGRR